jgi:hypothetical protein
MLSLECPCKYITLTRAAQLHIHLFSCRGGERCNGGLTVTLCKETEYQVFVSQPPARKLGMRFVCRNLLLGNWVRIFFVTTLSKETG